tara:strand:+ start:833 stop:934 length:102 start_codon:yes stop_codon:yes gene_type:complete
LQRYPIKEEEIISDILGILEECNVWGIGEGCVI